MPDQRAGLTEAERAVGKALTNWHKDEVEFSCSAWGEGLACCVDKESRDRAGNLNGRQETLVRLVLDTLRSLPVEQRMEAMGMTSVTFQPMDEPFVYWREPLDA